MSDPRLKAQIDAPVWPWLAFVVIASLMLSRAFACATPFAALATLAAFTLRRREAILLVVATWLGNQAIGFGFMHYPWTLSTVGWGIAIGVAALAAWAVARGVERRLAVSLPIALGPGLVGAYAAYELVLVAATAVWPSGSGAFALPVVLRIFAINVAALGLLIAARRLARRVGVPASNVLPSPHP